MNELSAKLKLKIFPTGDLEVNAYLVFDEDTKDCFLIDCPAPFNKYRDFILDNNLNLKFLVITHGHYDHIGGVEGLLSEFSIPFYVQKDDLPMLVNPLNNGSLTFNSHAISIKQAPVFCEDGDSIFLGEDRLKIIETPGHTLGSISLLMNNWLFSGDTLFYRSVGRTDFPFSSPKRLQKSIKDKLFKLDPKTLVYPGHGRQTSIEEEMESNPFVE